MGENSGSQGGFIQRYLTSQSLSPEYSNGMFSHHRSSESHIINSIPDDEGNNFSSRSNRTPECQKILNRISTFCGKENLVQRVSFLDQELSVFGYPSVVSDLGDASSPNQPQGGAIDLVTLVNISYDLLQSWRQSFESQSDANDLQRSSDAEIVRLRHLASRLKEDIANKDRDLKSKELMQLQLTQRLESFKKKLKVEQEKSKRLNAEMTARDSQFRHEKKKKIQEIEKLQSRLQQVLQDKRQERMLGIEILNSLQRSDGKRGKWSTDKTKKNNEQDMYRLVITNYEDSQKQLLKENEGMRRYLKEMQDELISALNERNISGVHDQSHTSMQGKIENQIDGEKQPDSRSSSAASNASDASDVSEPMSDGMFEMPFDLVKEDIEKSIRTKWRALKKEIRKTRKASRTDPPNRESVTENDYDDLVQQQQDLIDYLTTGQGEGNDRPIPEDCYFLEEKAELEKQKNLFKQQKQTLDKERQLYAEALVQLDDQRQAFELEKNKWLQQNFLQMTPFRDQRSSSTSVPQNLRGKEPSSHHSKSRQQPYRPRTSLSPDRPALKATDHSSNNSQSQSNMKNSPNNISHSLSKLHSSSHLNSSFSPDSHRSADISWQNHTPENNLKGLQRTKSTPNTMLPPSTAELYRSLGLVYYGSDKENDITVNTGNTSSRVCPQSSGTVHHHSMSHSPGEKIQSPKPRQGSYRIQSKIYPNADKQSPSSSEYISAATSLESGESDPKSVENEFFDAKKNLTITTQRREQRTVPRERQTKLPYAYQPVTGKAGEKNTFSNSEFRLSGDIARPNPQFLSSVPGKRKLYSSKSWDEKFHCQHGRDRHEKTRPKRSGIRNFVRNFLLGTSRHKSHDNNNNYIANSELLSNSDSALSLHYALNDGMKQESWEYPYPSANSECLNLSHTFSDAVCHQRTRSFPGDEILSSVIPKRRSYSYDVPVLTAAAERHKSALLSISVSHESVEKVGNFLPAKKVDNNESNATSVGKELKERFEKLNFGNNVIDYQRLGSKTQITSDSSLNKLQGFKFNKSAVKPDQFMIDTSRFDSGFKPAGRSGSTFILSDQSDSSFKPASLSGSTSIMTGESDLGLKLTISQSGSSFKPSSHSGSAFVLTGYSDTSFQYPSQSDSSLKLTNQSGSSFEFPSQSSSSLKMASQSSSNYQQEESNQNQFEQLQTSLNRLKPDEGSPSLLEQLTTSDLHYI